MLVFGWQILERSNEKTVAIPENYTLIFNCKCPKCSEDIQYLVRNLNTIHLVELILKIFMGFFNKWSKYQGKVTDHFFGLKL